MSFCSIVIIYTSTVTRNTILKDVQTANVLDYRSACRLIFDSVCGIRHVIMLLDLLSYLLNNSSIIMLHGTCIESNVYWSIISQIMNTLCDNNTYKNTARWSKPVIHNHLLTYTYIHTILSSFVNRSHSIVRINRSFTPFVLVHS